MLLHMTAILSRTTESLSTSIGTPRSSCTSDMLNLVVDWWEHNDRDLGRDVGLQSDGYVDGLWSNGVDVPLIYTKGTIDFGK